MTFWLRLKEVLRESDLDFTQKGAARLAGVAQPSVSDWNKPGGWPELETGITLAKKLGVCVEWLYTGRGPKYPLGDGDPYSEHLGRLWPRLTEQVRADIVALARLHVAAPATSVYPQVKTDPAPRVHAPRAVKN